MRAGGNTQPKLNGDEGGEGRRDREPLGSIALLSFHPSRFKLTRVFHPCMAIRSQWDSS